MEGLLAGVGDVLDALHLSAVVAGLLEVDLQVVLEVLLDLAGHILDVVQEDGPLRYAAERLRPSTTTRVFMESSV